MSRVSLTAFEADWLFMVIDTCREIASDTLPYVPMPPEPTTSDPFAAWDRIVDKVDDGRGKKRRSGDLCP